MMNADQCRRLATMIDMVLRGSTNSNERAAALGKITQAFGEQSVTELVNEMFASARSASTEQPTFRPSQPSAREKPWLEWKAEHERLLEAHERQSRRIAVLESPRYLKTRPQPDEDGNVPYPTFLVALLACRNWQVRDAISEFCNLTKVSQMDVTNWRIRGGAPYYYYSMLSELPFEGVNTRTPKPVWNEQALYLLDQHFPIGGLAMSDEDIAEALSVATGQAFGGRSVHAKAHKAGYLSRISGRKNRRLKTTKIRPAAPVSSAHSQD